MVRRGRDEIGKVGGGVLNITAAAPTKLAAAGAISPSSDMAAATTAAAPPPPPSSLSTKPPPRVVQVGDTGDDEDAVRAFDAALVSTYI